jgi:tetratricopeptide (TPR) repeat protein
MIALLEYSNSGHDSYSAELILAESYAKGQQYTRAIEHYRRLMDISPFDPYAAYVYGTTLLNAADKLDRPNLGDSALIYLDIAAKRLPRQEDLQRLVERLKNEAH